MTLLAHGGAWGAAAEVGGVSVVLVLAGFFLWRAKRKEEANR